MTQQHSCDARVRHLAYYGADTALEAPLEFLLVKGTEHTH